MTSRLLSNAMLKLGIALMVLLSALAIACGGDDDDDDGGSATDAPGATTGAPAATSEAPAATDAEETNAPTGPQDFTSTQIAPAVTITADSAWSVSTDNAGRFTLTKPQDASGAGALITVFVPSQVFAPDSTVPEALPADLAGFLKTYAKSGLFQEGDQPVTVGGLSGTGIGIMTNLGADFDLFQLADGSTFEMAASDRIDFYVLDGTDGPIVIAAGPDKARNYDAVAQLLHDTVDTIQFGN